MVLPAKDYWLSGREAGDETHFGEQTVPLADKQGMVDDVFHSVARRYDLMNDLMSGGLHRAWKDALVTAVNPPKSRPGRLPLLDLAGGTGDVAFRVVAGRRRRARTSPSATSMPTCSPSARERADERGLDDASPSSRAMPRSCPIPTAASIASPSPSASATCRASSARSAEAYRVLKIGGRFLCLEFSSVDVPGLDTLYDLYSFQVIPRVGQAVTGDREAYQYLVESIRKFPKPQAFAADDRGRPASAASPFTPMTGGVVALHSGWSL